MVLQFVNTNFGSSRPKASQFFESKVAVSSAWEVQFRRRRRDQRSAERKATIFSAESIDNLSRQKMRQPSHLLAGLKFSCHRGFESARSGAIRDAFAANLAPPQSL